jgi:hypothetical protein
MFFTLTNQKSTKIKGFIGHYLKRVTYLGIVKKPVSISKPPEQRSSTLDRLRSPISASTKSYEKT